MKRFNWSVLALLLSGLSVAQAALLDEARVVSATATLASMAPQPVPVTIATAGTYTLTLTDLGELPNPDIADPFTALSVVISQGAQKIKYLTVPVGAAVVTDSVVLATGQYQVQVLGVTPGASLYGVELKNASNVMLWGDSGAINAPPTSNFSTLQHTLTVTSGQSYTVRLTDQAFPAALNSLALIVTASGNQVGNCSLLAAGTCSFVATTNTVLLTVLAPNSSAGLYSVKVSNSGSGAVAYAVTLPVGDMPQPVSLSLPAADAYSLTSIDLQTPGAFSTFKLALVQGADVPVKQVAVGVMPAFSGTGGAASLYVIATPAANSAGLYSVQIKRGTTAIYSQVNAVESPASTGLEGYVFTANVPAAGNYTLQLRDFIFPQAFAQLAVNVTQEGTLLGSRASAGTLNITGVQAGEVSIAVLAQPGIGINPQGLFGISLTAANGTTPILEKNQGVGGKFTSTVLTVQQLRYALTATDFAAPLALEQLLVAVTRGSQLVGTIYGGGTFQFDATAGEYTFNIITKVPASGAYGMVGIALTAAPTVTLTASATSVASGSAAILNWSSTDASSCTASGGWTGSKITSGSASVGPLTANSTFTLTCTGPAGNAAQSVNITIQAAAASKSGGGSFSWLLTLGLVALARKRAVVAGSR